MDELSLGERELDLMTALWEMGSGTATEVRDALPIDLAYTTVLTLLRRLEAKGCLRREPEGKAHRYFPAVQRHTAQESALGHLIEKLFAGSAERLVAHLVDEDRLTAEDLARLKRRLADKSAGRGPRRPK